MMTTQNRRKALKSARDTTSLKSLNALRKIARMSKALSVHKRLIMFLQQNDVPKLRQTLGAALVHGASMGVLLEKLTETIEGTYRARGDYSETQYDAVTLVVRLGGPKLLFALARPLGLPSLNDWQRHRQILVQLWAGAGLDDLPETTMHNLVFKIYFEHGTKAMPGQLYHDLQRSINDLFQSVARVQSDPTNKPRRLFTFQLGTDRQEVEFAGVRTENHNRSMTATRLPESLSHELQIRSVFSTNAAFRERGSRRLGHSNDHVNARSTDGDRDVDVVNLLAEWCRAPSLRQRQ